MPEEDQNLPEVSQEAVIDPATMTFEDFDAEYTRVMQAVAHKEKLGGLDPFDPSTYKPMTDAEHKLMAEDWKAFSRSRGYSEEDITEYERWLKLSGQTDGLPSAINDPWRRRENHVGGWSKLLYLEHVQHQLEEGGKVSPEVQASYEGLSKQAEAAAETPTESSLPGPHTSDSVDVW